MPNFNSREVFIKTLAKYMLEYVSDQVKQLEFDKLGNKVNADRAIDVAVAILDSALLAAHPEASDLECDLRDRDYDNEQFVLSTKQAEVMIAAALETARREEREKIIRQGVRECIRLSRLCEDYEPTEFHLAVFLKSTNDMTIKEYEQLFEEAKKDIDSLTEKEARP